MPIGNFEREVLRIVASNRHPDSFLGGATVLHQASDSEIRDYLDCIYLHEKQACAEAEAPFERLPPAEMGCLYLNREGQPVCPQPDSPEFAKLTRHFGSVKGAWPRIVED